MCNVRIHQSKGVRPKLRVPTNNGFLKKLEDGTRANDSKENPWRCNLQVSGNDLSNHLVVVDEIPLGARVVANNTHPSLHRKRAGLLGQRDWGGATDRDYGCLLTPWQAG